MNNTPDVPHLGAIDLIAEYTRSDLTEAYAGLARRYPTWTAAQQRSLALFDNYYLDSMAALRRGIGRRFGLGAPAELALFLALGARYEWAKTGHARRIPRTAPESHFLPILQAVAVNDFEAAQRFGQTALPLAGYKPTVKEYLPLYRAVVALLVKDERELGDAVAAMDRCKPKAYVAAMFDTLRGAASRSPNDVAAGLNKALKAYPRYVFNDGVMRLIDPHVHGLFRLCQRFSEALVSQFDVRRALPWDLEFHEWTETHPNPLKDVNLNAVDPEVHQVLIKLEPPIWWEAEESSAW